MTSLSDRLLAQADAAQTAGRSYAGELRTVALLLDDLAVRMSMMPAGQRALLSVLLIPITALVAVLMPFVRLRVWWDLRRAAPRTR